MKVIVAGCRTVSDQMVVDAAILESGFEITELVSGAAQGVDLLGEAWAAMRSIPIQRFPADWKRNGRAAGPIRNQQMACYAEALVAIWDGQSRGTLNMIRTAQHRGLKVYLKMI